MRTALSLALSLLVFGSVAAAASTFDLSGRVLDENGIELTGVTLTLLHESTGLVRETRTNDVGSYYFAGLPAGSYTLTVRLAGFATSRFAGLRYFADTKPIFNVTLRLREVQESMTFTGEAPLINVSQSQVGLSVEERQLRELPLRRRDYLELAGLEGNAREIEESPPGAPVVAAPQETVNGASAFYTAYQLDGFQNTRDQHGVVFVDVSLETVEEFRVISGPLSAEYGESLAGIVSATTVAGGNDLHGSAFAFLRPGAWDAADPLTGLDTALDRKDVGLTLSVPLVTEKSLLFFALDYRNADEDVAVTAPFDGGRYRGLAPLPSERWRALAKLSQRLGEAHRVTVKAAFSDRSALEGVGGFDVPESGLETTNDDVALYGTLVSELGASLSELRVGLGAERFRAAAGPPPLGPALRHPLLGNVGSPTRLERADETHVEIAETLSFGRGAHAMKAGGSVLRISSESELERFTDGLLVFAPRETLEPILFWQSAPPPRTGTVLSRSESHLQAFFQDDWQLTPYLTVNLGLQWQMETSVGDDDNVAPRLGFHWDPTRDGRTSVRGGYGVFYSSVFSIVDTLERLYGPSGFHLAATLPGDRARVGEAPANLYVDAPSFAAESRRSPYAHHASFGVEREILKSLSIALDVSHVRGEGLILPTDLNAPSFFDYAGGARRSPAEADATRPFGAPGAPIPPGALSALPEGFPFADYRDLYLLASRGESRYWGARVNVTKRYGSDFMVQAVYQWSRTRNDGDDYSVETSIPLDPGAPGREWARAATDVPHALVVDGVWSAPWGFRFTGLLRARSGRPIDPKLGLDLDGDLKLRERAASGGAILERNAFRAPSIASLDLSVSKRWDLGETRRLEATLDVFNVLNRLNPKQVLDTYGPGEMPLEEFLKVAQAAPPRQLQLSVRFLF